jgi:hypothetical protein
MGTEKLYVALSRTILAYRNCFKRGNLDWERKHMDRVLALIKEHMPSGSGFDNGTSLDVDASTEEKLVFSTGYHHMNENGFYDGWTEHKVTVRASLAFGFRLTVSGRNRNDIKDYIGEAFHFALSTDVDDGRAPFFATEAAGEP